MSDQSWMSMQENLVITRNAISLQESVDGQEHSNLPSGTQADLFGQEALRVNPSQSLEKVREKTIADTSGLSSLISLESAILQQCLENKLHQLSNLDGSMIYKMTLRKKVTPQQRVYSHLGLSGLRTKGTDSSLLPSAWPTPLRSDGRGSAGVGKKELPNIAKLTAWPTLQAMDAARGPIRSLVNGQRIDKKGVRFGLSLVTAATLSPWATPTATDPKRGTKPPRPHDTGIPLTQQVSGLNPQSSTAETESTVPSQLNPRFSLYLMGYPIEWAYSGEQVTRLSHKRQQK